MYWNEFLTVAIIHLLAVASPGPDFAIIVREATTIGRKNSCFVAIGIGVSVLFHVSYSLLGLGLLVSQSASLFNIFKWVASIYLFYLGAQAFRSSFSSVNVKAEQRKAIKLQSISLRSSFVRGLLVNGLNPKAVLFFLSLFTVVVSPSTPIPVQLGYGIYLSTMTSAWFCFIAILFSMSSIRFIYIRFACWIDRLMGVFLMVLAVSMLLTHH